MTNFDLPTHRRNTASYKWDSAVDDDILPLWVADMDFPTAPCIIEALRQRVDHGIFGYTRVPEEFYNAAIDWFAEKHRFSIDRSWIIYTSGVVPAISATIKALTQPGDKIIVQTPVYNCFFSSIRNNGCEILPNPLIYADGSYSMDFDDLAEKASDPSSKILLLCNPHNPAGRVWTPEELRRLGEICMANGVTVLSDEIHCELVYEPYTYTPYGSLGDEFARRSVTFISPSKAFNIAGLQIADIVCADSEWRQKIDRAININEVCDVNPFGVTALIAAYRHGSEWLEELKNYLNENYLMLLDFFRRELPWLTVTKLESTYLVWVDCRSMRRSSDEIEHELYEEGRVWLNGGSMYGPEGNGFMRINIACQRSTLSEALKRISHVWRKYEPISGYDAQQW